MTLEIGVNHHVNESLEVDRWRPTEMIPCLRWVSGEQVDFGRTEMARIRLHEFAIVQAGVTKRRFTEITHGERLPGTDHIVVRLVLLQHPPHSVDVVAGEAPITT